MRRKLSDCEMPEAESFNGSKMNPGRLQALLLVFSIILPCAGYVACAPQHKTINTEAKIMRVTVQRSGGFTGIPLIKSIDGASMSPQEETQLRKMIDEADFFQLPSTIQTIPEPDRFQYQITIEQEGKSHSVTCAETAIPPKLKPLLNWLMESARQPVKPTR